MSQHQQTRDQGTSLSHIRATLVDVLGPFVDQSHISLQTMVSNLDDEQLQLLHRQGYCDSTFRDALATFFSSELGESPAVSTPMPGVTSYNLQAGDQREIQKIRLFGDILDLASTVSATELGDFLRSCSGYPALFPEIELKDLKKFSGQFDEIIKLGQLQIDWQDYTNKFQTCLAITENSGSAETVEQLAELTDRDGKAVFEVAWDFRQFIQNGGGHSEAVSLLELTNTAGDYLFQTANELSAAQRHQSKDADNFSSCIQANDKWGNPVFRYGVELTEYLDNNGDSTKATELANLEAPGGIRAFNGYEIMMLQEAKIDAPVCAEWARQGLDAVQEIYRTRLKLDSADFANDGRDKALILVPTDDSPQFGMRAFLDASQPFYRTIVNGYDVCIRPMWSSQDAWDYIDLYGEESSLIIASGHGFQDGITVGRDTGRYYSKPNGLRRKIKADDYELLGALSRLKPGTVLFLDSCATAQGGTEEDHFASGIANNCPNIDLIAARDSFSAKNIVVDEVNPLRLKIFSSQPGVGEITYTASDGSASAPSRDQYETTMAFRKRAVPLSYIEPSKVVSLPNKGPRNEQLKEVAKEISLASYPLVYPDDMQAAADKVANIPGVTVVEQRNLLDDFEQTTWQYLFGEHRRESWCPTIGNTYGSESSAIESDPLGLLSSKGYRAVETPENGDIGIYFSRRLIGDVDLSHPLNDAFPFHYGEYRDGEIISKPFRMHVIQHPMEVYPVPDEYQIETMNYLVFFRKFDD